MSADFEMWTREDGDLAPLLPRAAEWQSFEGGLEFEGDDWLLSVCEPERVDADEVPPELRALIADLAYRVGLTVEPINPPAGAWSFVEEVLASIGRNLGGAATDPESGAARSWAE